MGNGAKAQQKRERNADKGAAKGSKSQAKVNEAAKNIVCATCKQAFVTPDDAGTCVSLALVGWSSKLILLSLEEHSQNKHSKGMAECFPNYVKP
ncbi:hypothetical protein HWV62_30378 [Athelia sp. TMB]|nr:hypothetical protein HWV62_30378 [Athelia sp. TMB]